MRVSDIVGAASLETSIKIWDDTAEDVVYEGNGMELVDVPETDEDSLGNREVLLISAGEGVLVITI